MVGALADVVASALVRPEEMARAQWAEFLELGLVTGSPEDLTTMAVNGLPGVEADPAGRAEISRDDVRRVKRWADKALLKPAVDLQASLGRAFLRDAEGLAWKVANGELSKGSFGGRMKRLARSYGEGGFTGAIADTWWETITNAAYNRGILETFRHDPTKRLFPWFIYRHRRDDRVRPAHRRLGDFVARVDDPIWRLLTPPLGWRCRCQLVAVDARRAAQIGWAGDYPNGVQQLGNFEHDGSIVAPGPDDGFVSPLLRAFAPV